MIEGCDMGEERSGKAIPKPACFDEMIDAAEKLAAPFDHARVDFYITGVGSPKLVFGEITFTSGSGFDRFHRVRSTSGWVRSWCFENRTRSRKASGVRSVLL